MDIRTRRGWRKIDPKRKDQKVSKSAAKHVLSVFFSTDTFGFMRKSDSDKREEALLAISLWCESGLDIPVMNLMENWIMGIMGRGTTTENWGVYECGSNHEIS